MSDFIQNWPDLRVGDLVYVLGPQQGRSQELEKLSRASWVRKLIGISGSDERVSPFEVLIALEDEYVEHAEKTGREPVWCSQVPENFVRYLRMHWIRSEHFNDPLAIVPFRRELNFSFGILADGLVHDVCIALNIFRLGSIRQLSFLHDPVINELYGERGLAGPFEHNRYDHSLTVMAVAVLMGVKVGLSEHELRHLLVAAVSHDTLTPAGGDAVKFLNPEDFDEDAHYPEIFRDNHEWVMVRDRYQLSEELLAAAVRGEGLLGKILDLADKSVYVAHDIEAYLMSKDPTGYTAFQAPPSLLSVWKFRRDIGQPICNLWENVERVGEEIVVNDAVRLADFLKLRALLFKHLYYNPKSRYREQMLATLILDCLYAEKAITREILLVISDSQLSRLVDQASGRLELSWALAETDVAPRIEAFATLAEAKERWRALLKSSPSNLVMIEAYPAVSEKAVRFLTRSPDGDVRPLLEVLPDSAAEILGLGADPKPVKLYWLALDKTKNVLSEAIRSRLLRRQLERLQQD